MPGIDAMGVENDEYGICGFTSTLYAVYSRRPNLQNRLDTAMGDTTRRTRMMAEIKTFLQMMRANGKFFLLRDIAELTRSFPGYEHWSVNYYIKRINRQIPDDDYSIAMPPEATMEYMRTAWDMRPALVDTDRPGDVILGLTRSGAPANRWKNLAHYVFRDAAGTIYSWGDQFTDLDDVNARRDKDYSVIYRIMVHG